MDEIAFWTARQQAFKACVAQMQGQLAHIVAALHEDVAGAELPTSRAVNVTVADNPLIDGEGRIIQLRRLVASAKSSSGIAKAPRRDLVRPSSPKKGMADLSQHRGGRVSVEAAIEILIGYNSQTENNDSFGNGSEHRALSKGESASTRGSIATPACDTVRSNCKERVKSGLQK
jgi:hypothetical protein